VAICVIGGFICISIDLPQMATEFLNTCAQNISLACPMQQEQIPGPTEQRIQQFSNFGTADANTLAIRY